MYALFFSPLNCHSSHQVFKSPSLQVFKSYRHHAILSFVFKASPLIFLCLTVFSLTFLTSFSLHVFFFQIFPFPHFYLWFFESSSCRVFESLGFLVFKSSSLHVLIFHAIKSTLWFLLFQYQLFSTCFICITHSFSCSLFSLGFAKGRKRREQKKGEGFMTSDCFISSACMHDYLDSSGLQSLLAGIACGASIS